MGSTATPRVVLVSLDEALTRAWRTEFDEWAGGIDIRTASIESVLHEVDAVISAGNSYGEMSGGVDLALAKALPHVQQRVWQRITERHLGYQPVGTAEIVPTGEPGCRWLIYAPTMRIPMPLSSGHEIAVHDAFWSALLAVNHHNAQANAGDRITSFACPGLGTGTGRVPPAQAAALMGAAYWCWRTSPAAPLAREELLSDCLAPTQRSIAPAEPGTF